MGKRKQTRGKKNEPLVTDEVHEKDSPPPPPAAIDEMSVDTGADEGIADVIPRPDAPDPLIEMLTTPRILIKMFVAYAITLLIALGVIFLVIFTLPPPNHSSSRNYSGEEEIKSTFARIAHSIQNNPIASFNVVIIYIVLPFVVSVGATKAGIALCFKIGSWMNKRKKRRGSRKVD